MKQRLDYYKGRAYAIEAIKESKKPKDTAINLYLQSHNAIDFNDFDRGVLSIVSYGRVSVDSPKGCPEVDGNVVKFWLHKSELTELENFKLTQEYRRIKRLKNVTYLAFLGLSLTYLGYLIILNFNLF